MKKSHVLGLVCIFLCTWFSNTLAYTVTSSVQALSNPDPASLLVTNTDIDGVTFISASVGPLTSNQGGGTATAFASVDLATGKLRGSGSISGASTSSTALANTSFTDLLSFSLAPGLSSATIGFSLTIDGTFTPLPDAHANGFASIQLGNVTVTSSPNTTSLGNIFGRTLSGQIDIFGDTDLQIHAILNANIGPGSSGNVSFDYLNTGSVSFNLPVGVTYTSESGVFLTAVPIPAGVWLFGSGLLGLVGMARLKKT